MVEPFRAKLTRPRLHRAVARERLFSRLDSVRAERRAICVVAPPGAGKTTLVASWSDARGIKGIWYQVDPADADPATFFYYLGEAAQVFLRRGRPALPALTPEYLHDIPGFARRFFRDLFALLPREASLVLDNYQEVPAHELFHQLIADAVAEVPERQLLVVISRRDPPSAYARLIANEGVAFVDWDDLRLTLDETRAIVAARGALPTGEVERLHTESGGWAAGVTLMLEGRRRSESTSPDTLAERELLFDYFAAQIFAQVPERAQRFLMVTALMTQVPVSIARDLTGEAAAGEILESLYQRHLFTHRRAGSEPTYWYHALFRDYLLVQCARLLSPQERREHERKAARLLESTGVFDEAFAMFRGAHDWDAVARLAERQAENLLAHGRGQTLREWISALPAERVERDPWLRYWLGTALVPVDQRHARGELEAAYELFASAGSREGQALAAAGVLEAYHFEWSDFAQMALWVERLAPLVDEGLFPSAVDGELKLCSSLLMGIYYGAPRHAMLGRCLQRVSDMLDERLDPNSRAKAATFLLAYCNLSGDLARGEALVKRFAALQEAPEISPLNALWWMLRVGHYHTVIGEVDAARADFHRAHAIAQAHGLSGLRSAMLLLYSYELLRACNRGDTEAAQQLAREAEVFVNPARPMDNVHRALHNAYAALARRDAAALCRWAHTATMAAERAGLGYTLVIVLLYEAHGLAIVRNDEQLHANLARVRELIAGTSVGYFECEVRYLLAYCELRSGPPNRALEQAKEAVRYARETGYHYPHAARYSPTVLTVLSACLAGGVETAYVHDVIRRYRLRPVDNALPQWPWPIRILTLGRFDVHLDGVPLRFAAKTPRKPLALLKALVAFGGSEVPQGKLIDALWPDDDGDAGKQTLGVTMVRLRKLLGVPEAILVADERVSLNPALCWVDAYAFEAKLKQSDALRSGRSPEEAVQAIEEAARLYEGAFLPGDAESAWTVQLRLRLRGLFTATIEDLAGHYEAHGKWEQAIACYRRGVEADDLVEEFYLGMMRCYRALRRPAEGMGVYRRLRQTLSVVLGVAPSAASEAAARALRECGQPHTD